MSIKTQLDSDLKTAMLAGDKVLATTLRGLKSAILYVEVAEGKRDEGITDDQIIELFTKEAKKRQESADLYVQGGNLEKSDAELAEKTVIEKYLPTQLSDAELEVIVDQVIESVGNASKETMGPIIGSVKAKVGAQADGGRIAALVRKKIS